MSDHLTNHWAQLGKIIADECNIKKVILNGVTVHEEPMLADKYQEKQKKFDEIYGEHSVTEVNENNSK